MADPNWNRGFYYDGLPPHTGMKLARRTSPSLLLPSPLEKLTHPLDSSVEIATITYRSGPEWDIRFGRQLKPQRPEVELTADPSLPRAPALCPDFLIETYLDHQGEQFCLKYDANSLIYISKAMDLFDLTRPALEALKITPAPPSGRAAPAALPHRTSHSKSHPPPSNPPAYLPDLAAGLRPLAHTPVLVLGVQSDILFPVEQQREVARIATLMFGADVEPANVIGETLRRATEPTEIEEPEFRERLRRRGPCDPAARRQRALRAQLR